MTSSTEAIAARWLTDPLPPLVNLDLDHPTIVTGIWIGDDTLARDVYSMRGPGPQGVLKPLPDGRYRITCDDGVRRCLTLDQLLGVA